VADHTIVSCLGWSPGTRLDMRILDGLLIIRHAIDGGWVVTKHGHLRLPAELRHSCGIRAGDRVLLVAYRAQDVLVVHPPASLDALLASSHAELVGGDLA
jgi:hypothetical protein